MARLWGSMINDNKSWRKLTRCFVFCGFAFWLCSIAWQHIGSTLAAHCTRLDAATVKVNSVNRSIEYFPGKLGGKAHRKAGRIAPSTRSTSQASWPQAAQQRNQRHGRRSSLACQPSFLLAPHIVAPLGGTEQKAPQTSLPVDDVGPVSAVQTQHVDRADKTFQIPAQLIEQLVPGLLRPHCVWAHCNTGEEQTWVELRDPTDAWFKAPQVFSNSAWWSPAQARPTPLKLV